MEQSQNNKNIKIIQIIGLITAIVAVVLAAILACKQAGVCTFSTGCSFNGDDGCASLGKLPSSKLPLLGVSVASVGLFYYLFLAGVFLQMLITKAQDRMPAFVTILTSAVVFGAVFDSFLAYQNFVTLSPCRDGIWFCPKCSLCAWTYVTQAILLGLSFYLYNSESQKSPQTGELNSLGLGFKYSALSLVVAIILTSTISLTMGANNASAEEQENAPPKIHLPESKKIEKILKQFKKTSTTVSMKTSGLTSVEGPKHAIVEIHKFADFLCGHCLHASMYLRFLRERWPNRIKIYYRYLPLDGSCNFLAGGSNPAIATQRCGSAKAAWCAGEQGPEYFKHFYHGVFEFQTRQVPPESDALEALSKKIGGNWAKQKSCMASRAQKGINRDLNVIDKWMKTKKLDQPSTPIMVLNNQLLGAGVPDFRSFIYWVDAMIIAKDGQNAIDDFNKLHPWATKKGEDK